MSFDVMNMAQRGITTVISDINRRGVPLDVPQVKPPRINENFGPPPGNFGSEFSQKI